MPKPLQTEMAFKKDCFAEAARMHQTAAMQKLPLLKDAQIQNSVLITHAAKNEKMSVINSQ